MSDSDAPDDPSGESGVETDRDPVTGRFLPGNAASRGELVAARVYHEHAEARQAIFDELLGDVGHDASTAPMGLKLAAAGAAEAKVLQSLAFDRMLTLGHPQSARDSRPRRAYQVWKECSGVLGKFLQRLNDAASATDAARQQRQLDGLSIAQLREMEVRATARMVAASAAVQAAREAGQDAAGSTIAASVDGDVDRRE